MPRPTSTPGPPPRPTTAPPPPPTAPTAPTADEGFYGRMFSGDTVAPAGAPTRAPPWRAIAVVVGLVATLGIAATLASRLAAPTVVERHPLLLAAEDERALAELWLRFGAPGPVRQDGVAHVVATAGAAVASPMKARLGARPPRFVVIEHSAPRTTALPDATIAISTGLLGLLENDAELAAVLGHTLAHVAAGHLQLFVTDDEERAIRAGLGGAAPGAAIDALTAANLTVGTPANEQAADALLWEGVQAAGRSSVAAADGLQRLHRSAATTGSWGSVHPVTAERQQRLRAVPPSGVVDATAFREAIRRPLDAGIAPRR